MTDLNGGGSSNRPCRADSPKDLAMSAGYLFAGAGVAETLHGDPLSAMFLVLAALVLRWYARRTQAPEPSRGDRKTEGPGWPQPMWPAPGWPQPGWPEPGWPEQSPAQPGLAEASQPLSQTPFCATEGGGADGRLPGDDHPAPADDGSGHYSEARYPWAAELLRSFSAREPVPRNGDERFTLVPVGLAEDIGPPEGRTDFFDTANRISRRLGSSHNIKRMANNFVTEAMEIFKFNACALWIFDETGQLSFVITRAPSNPARDGIRLGDEIPPGSHAILRECGSGESPVPEGLVIEESAPWRGLFPLSVEGCPLGVFQAEGSADPTRDGRELLTSLLNQFSLIFLNIRLARQITLISEDISKRDFEFVTLDVFSRITNRSTDTDRIIEFTLEFVSKALELTSVVLTVEKEGKTAIGKERGHDEELRLLKNWWKSVGDDERVETGCRCFHLPKEVSARLNELPGRPPGGAGHLSTVLKGGEVMTLIFFSVARELKPRSRKFLEMVGKQVQVAVDSSSTLASLDRKVRLLNLIYAVCGAMAEKVSFEERMERVVDYLKVFLDVSGCGIFAREGSSGGERFRSFLSKGFSPCGDDQGGSHAALLDELRKSEADAEGFFPRSGCLEGLFVSALSHGDRPAGFLVVDGGPGFSGSGTRDFEVVRAVSVLVSQMVADHWMNLEVGELKELLSSVFDTVDDAILVLDSNGMILSENVAVAKIFGPRTTRDARLLLSEFPLAVDRVEEALVKMGPGAGAENAMPVSGAGDAVSIQPIFNSGSTRAIEVFAAPMGRDSLVVTIREVTERWNMQKELRRVERLAALGEMAAGMAHEIRNPLGGIKVLASFLASSLSGDSQKKEMADTILGGVAEVDARIGSLLGYAKPESPDISTQDLNSMVTSGLDIYMAEAAAHGIVFDLTGLSPPGAARVLADPSKFGQVLGNILRNAIQAQPDGGGIRIWTAGPGPGEGGDRARVVVEDAGPGMDPGSLSRIYDPFFTTKPEGTGLGMAISQKIILAMGGDILTESSPGNGTRVTIFLPTGPS